MKTRLNIIASINQLKNKHDAFKIKYKTWYHLANQSGFGRDPHNNAVTAPDEVWDRYLDKHPKAKEFRTSAKPIRYEAFLNTLFFDVLATGEEAVDVNDFDEGEDKDMLDEEEDALDPSLRLAAVDNLYDEEQSFSQSSNPISQSLSAASSVPSLRKLAGTASASGPSEGLKRIRKTGSEHLTEAITFLSTSNEQQTSQVLKDKNFETPIERALGVFFPAFEDLDMEDQIRMTEVFEDETKARIFLSLTSSTFRRRWVERQLEKLQEEIKKSS